MGLGNYSESTEQRRLSGIIEKRGAQTGMSTAAMFLFGTPFAGFGTFFALMGLKIVPANPSSVHAPYSVITICGLVFACAGLMVWNMAWQQYRSNHHRTAALEHHINEPALEDYDWDPRGFRSHCWARTAKSVLGTGFLGLFLSIFNWWAWFGPGPLPVKIFVSLFDLWLAYACWLTILTFSRAVRFGNSRIEFVQFPYRLNQPIVVRWLTPPGISRANNGKITLRCVKEYYETAGSGSSRSRYIVHEELWSGTWSFDQPEDFPPGKNIEFEFQPAADLPATCLSGPQTVFWEFEIDLSLPGPDFKESYLVPVYASESHTIVESAVGAASL